MNSRIDCVIFLGKQELSFTIHDESKDRADYVKPLSFLAKHDKDLEFHRSTIKVCTETLDEIQQTES